MRWPRQGVSALSIPYDLLINTVVFLVGSPANHDPDNNRIEGVPRVNNVEFKSQVFYSMCWATPADSVVAMTWSLGACCPPDLAWWTDQSDRVLVVAPAFFRSYRPRMGLADTDAELSHEADTMISLYVPVTMMPCLGWVNSKLDAASTIVQFMRAKEGRMVTFGAYTAELELDVMSAI